jgi:hypothetical protein
LLTKYGVWLRGPDLDVMKAVRKIEAALRKDHPGLLYVWSPEPTTAQAAATTETQIREWARGISEQLEVDDGNGG